MMEWQKIETAPDGVLLLWNAGCVPYIGYKSLQGDWWQEASNHSTVPWKCHPTHWMPLPTPPQERSDVDLYPDNIGRL